MYMYAQSKTSICNVFVLSAGAIAIRGGLFSEPLLPVLIGNVDCSGEEQGLLLCPHLTESDEVVSQCDPNENGAVRCQGKLHFIILY